MATIWAIAAFLATVVIVVGTLLTPAPKRWAKPRGFLALRRRDLFRQRLQQRRSLLLVYAGGIAGGAVVLIIWVLPAVLTEHPHITSAVDRHKAITDTR